MNLSLSIFLGLFVFVSCASKKDAPFAEVEKGIELKEGYINGTFVTLLRLSKNVHSTQAPNKNQEEHKEYAKSLEVMIMMDRCSQDNSSYVLINREYNEDEEFYGARIFYLCKMEDQRILKATVKKDFLHHCQHKKFTKSTYLKELCTKVSKRLEF